MAKAVHFLFLFGDRERQHDGRVEYIKADKDDDGEAWSKAWIEAIAHHSRLQDVA